MSAAAAPDQRGGPSSVLRLILRRWTVYGASSNPAPSVFWFTPLGLEHIAVKVKVPQEQLESLTRFVQAMTAARDAA